MNAESPRPLNLEAHRAAFAQRRFLAMPLAGMLAWLLVGIGGLFLTLPHSAWLLFIATGSIVYLGLFMSRFTGENLMAKDRPRNPFDILFLLTVVMALAVFSIAIPFFLVDPTSLPLTVGILTGLMWIPLSWSLQHWIGLAHGLGRTVAVLAAWYAFPDQRFVVVPFLIVALYAVTIAVLERRWRTLGNSPGGREPARG